MPTRFNYVPVQPDSFALTPAEILLADDKDLNEYVGLKKMAPYRDRAVKWDVKRNERLKEFRERMKERGRVWNRDKKNGERGGGGEEGKKKKKKRAGKNERKKRMKDDGMEVDGGT